MQQYKNDMDKITVSDELKSKILAAADKKIKNSKIISFKRAAAAAAGLAVCISVSGLMHGFITSRNKPQQELKPSASKTEQPKTEKNDNIADNAIIGNPLPLKTARRRNLMRRTYHPRAMRSLKLALQPLRSHRIMHLTRTKLKISVQNWGTLFRFRTVSPTDMRRRARICFLGHWFS